MQATAEALHSQGGYLRGVLATSMAVPEGRE
jgi:hypothetical protein